MRGDTCTVDGVGGASINGGETEWFEISKLEVSDQNQSI